MRRPAWLTSTLLVAGALIAAIGVVAYRQQRLRHDLTELQWDADLRWYNSDRNTISLSVGVIQFLRNGFSVTLDSVRATGSGVELVGYFGNPKAINLSSLTVEFQVEQPMWKFRDVWNRNKIFFILSDTLLIGKAQTLVGDVGAGGRAPFRVVIPDVKGDFGQFVVAVKLSGERYQYMR